MAGEGHLTPYLAVADGRAAIDWYCTAFGATLAYEPIVMPDGRVGHAEVHLFDALIYLSDAHPEIGVVEPASSGNDVTLHVEVASSDAVMARAEKLGAIVVRECSDTPHGRIGVMKDPFGHRWMFNSPASSE